MKILLSAHQFFPDHASGTEVLTLDTAKEYEKLGHHISVVTGYPEKTDMSDGSRFDTYDYEGIRVHRFRHAYVPMGGQDNILELEYDNRLFARYFRDLLLKEKPDIVHFFHLARLSASAIDVCKDLDIPMVLTPTDFWFVCPMSQLRMPDNSLCLGSRNNNVNCVKHYVQMTQPPEIVARVQKVPKWALGLMIWGMGKGMFSKRWFTSYVQALSHRPAFLMSRMNQLDRVVFPTRLMEKILIDNGLSPKNMTYSPFGINLTNIKQTSPKSASEKLRLGFMGTLFEHKGAHVLIEAVRALPDCPDIELNVYGRLEEFPDYVAFLKRLAGDDDRISFEGTFPNAKIGEIFSQLDVLVVPSIWYENTPLVIYSAQAAGCPVIATDLGGMSEAVAHGENGLLFEPGDVNSLASLIRQLYEDKDLAGLLSRNAKRPKSVTEYAQELLKIYAEIFKERQSMT